MKNVPIRSVELKNYTQEIARGLLDIEALMLGSAEKPFVWSSGMKTPIYCDNRKLLSHPQLRTHVKEALVSLTSGQIARIGAVAGVATGAIPLGALVADLLGLPFYYVKKSKKGHGTQKLVEGDLEALEGKKVLVVEDLISTGESSLKAVKALEDVPGVEVTGMVAIFSYQLPTALKAFKEAGVEAKVVLDYPGLLEIALKNKYITREQSEDLQEWYWSPPAWEEKHFGA